MSYPKKARPPEYKPRKCKYCRLTFVPVVGAKGNRRNAELQKFCGKKCKDAYHRNGGMNWERFTERVDALVRKLVRDELQKTGIIEEIRDIRAMAASDRATRLHTHTCNAVLLNREEACNCAARIRTEPHPSVAP